MKNRNFASEIETICTNRGVEYIDAIVFWCEKNKIEVETVANWVKNDPVMRSKIQFEAENMNILKRGARLPI